MLVERHCGPSSDSRADLIVTLLEFPPRIEALPHGSDEISDRRPRKGRDCVEPQRVHVDSKTLYY
jgi:hypothetical protein